MGTDEEQTMGAQNLEKWHAHLRGELPGGLDDLLADDVVFYSPVVFTPQEGKEITKLYLSAAGSTFSEGNADKAPGQTASSFRYVKEVVCGSHMVLEFESQIEGKYINGVDVITWNDEGRITEFKVMIRPLQAVNMMHAQMKAMLEKMQG
jgi:hypothetical protein